MDLLRTLFHTLVQPLVRYAKYDACAHKNKLATLMVDLSQETRRMGNQQTHHVSLLNNILYQLFYVHQLVR